MVYISYGWIVIPTIAFLVHCLQLRRILHRSLTAFCKNEFVYFVPSKYPKYALKCATILFKNGLTPILIKCCSCFSLVLCPHIVGYHVLHVEPLDTPLANFSTKNSFGENSKGLNSDRRNFRSVIFPSGENSVPQKFRSAKIPSVKIPRAEIAQVTTNERKS